MGKDSGGPVALFGESVKKVQDFFDRLSNRFVVHRHYGDLMVTFRPSIFIYIP